MGPTYQVRDELRGDGIQKFTTDRDTRLGELAEELACDSETLIDLERSIDIGWEGWSCQPADQNKNMSTLTIVDETLPADGRSGLSNEESESAVGPCQFDKN